MKLKTTIPSIAAALLAAAPFASAQNATTDPVGFVTANITAGTGTVKKLTLFSAPLLDSPNFTGQMSGTITSLTSNSISNSNAGWIAGELSSPSAPCVIQITSGNAAGRMFLIASSASTGGASSGTPNTATTITISSLDSVSTPDLAAAGVAVGDSYKILSCDTLSSLFGTPESNGVLGGANSTAADSIILVVNGSANTYFYSTSSSRWSRVGPGTPDASNTAVTPYTGIQYQRLAATPLSFTFTGGVPTVQREQSIKNSGLTYLSQYYPTDVTIAALALQNTPGWVSGASAAVSDTINLVANGSVNTYWYNGTNWRRVGPGTPISDTTIIPAGTAVKIIKLTSGGSGYSAFDQPLPYSL
jgi:hypothetical protein